MDVDFRVRNVDFLYDNDNNVAEVNVRHDAVGVGTTLNGVVKLTVQEYMANATNLNGLAAIVKQKITDQLVPPTETTTETTETV